MNRWLLYYYLTVNIILFALMFWDKRQAVKGGYRLSEACLWLWGICGGALGGLVGMKFFHHKTKKAAFWFIYILAIIMHIFIFVYIWPF